MSSKTFYRAVPCPCRSPNCKNWLVDPVAGYQGVSFTKKQAETVADVLNAMEEGRPIAILSDGTAFPKVGQP